MQMNNAKLSIIVPIYGVEQYLNRCIQSIVNVNYKNIEIILVDDGSKDGCPAICDSWEQKDNRIKVIHKPNGGLVSARKAGLEIATGQYATYVDGDDWIEPEMYDCLEQYEADLIVEGFVSDRGERTEKIVNQISVGRYTGEKLETIKGNMIMNKQGEFIVFPCVWNKIFRLDKLKTVQSLVPNNISMGEDVAVTYSYILKSNSIVVTNECFYHYILNPSGMTSEKNIRYIEKCYVLFDYLNQMDALLGNQLNNYLCSMMVNGIGILFDPRVKSTNVYRHEIVKEYRRRDYLKNSIESSERYRTDRVVQYMIDSFAVEKYATTMFATCIHILKNHLS